MFPDSPGIKDWLGGVSNFSGDLLGNWRKEMAKRVRRIVVAGDVSIDWLQITAPGEDLAKDPDLSLPNWRRFLATQMVAQPGGALLLARMVEEATGKTVAKVELKGLERIPPEKTIHSFAQVDLFPYSTGKKDKKNFYHRISKSLGFAGPHDVKPNVHGVTGDNPNATVLVLDDAGNGFRNTRRAWPKALKDKSKKPIIIYKMSSPIAKGDLWQAVRRRHAERLVVVVSADFLRAEGVNISRRLSWERTAKDFLWQLACNPVLEELKQCHHLVVRFGIDGAIYTRRDAGSSQSWLLFDPLVAENGFSDEFSGQMHGFNSAFVAALAARITKEKLSGIKSGIADGIRSSRRLLCEGFGRKGDPLEYPCAKLFGPSLKSDAEISEIKIPGPQVAEPADPGFWCIIKEHQGVCLEDMAYEIVEKGDSKSMKGVPVGRFGFLKTVDRAEIESYRSIKNLIIEYLDTPKAKRPLSLAVFGPPGSGKSFGVTQVAESVAPGRIKKIEFNISQFQSQDELIKAFHKVRDVVLGGDVPLVFFDEFDTALESNRLGWLKYFLAPMQDGEFRDGETTHPIGKAIFVFAGGTSESYDEFCCGRENDPHKTDHPELFRDAKGTDFVSRLRGYINILGINADREGDQLYMVRRAIIMRSMLERFAKQLIGGRSKRARIDAGVLRAILKVPVFKHGVRSLEAILDMSMLAGQTHFEQASLPPAAQLKLHVDSDLFSRFVVRDVLFGSAREQLGKAIHEQYLIDQAENKPSDDPAMRPWDLLDEGYRESCRQQADHIPEKLRLVKCSFHAVKEGEPGKFKFRKSEVEKLAEKEHSRWNMERRLAGWRYGRVRDKKKKTSPYLVEWDKLTDDVKGWDRDVIINLPKLMAGAGFQIYRMDCG